MGGETLATMLRELLAHDWQSNPAAESLVHDFAKFHAFLAVVGGVLVLVSFLLTAVLWKRWKAASRTAAGRWAFEKRTYFSFGIGSLVFGLLMTVVTVANTGHALDPVPGLRLMIDGSTKSSDSATSRAMATWLQSGSPDKPSALDSAIDDRLSWQQPKAIICAILFVIVAALAVRLWTMLVRRSRERETKRSLTDRALLAAGVATVPVSLLLLIMAVANTQGSIAPIAITVLGGS